MSYARLGAGSDVYVYASDGGVVCSGCLLDDAPDPVLDRRGMIEHLLAHRRAGDAVPAGAIDRLWAELVEESRDSEPGPGAPSSGA